jgi:hypothetical protein
MPKKSRYELLKGRLPKAVKDLTNELQKVMQIVTNFADLNVNLKKECFLVHDMYENFERIMNGFVNLDELIYFDSDLEVIYGDIVMAQKNYSELDKTLKAIEELKWINNVIKTVGDDLPSHKADLSQRCMKIIHVIKGDYIPLPYKIINDMTAIMRRLSRAKLEPASPTGSTTVEPPLLPPYGYQMFAANSMFLPPVSSGHRNYLHCAAVADNTEVNNAAANTYVISVADVPDADAVNAAANNDVIGVAAALDADVVKAAANTAVNSVADNTKVDVCDVVSTGSPVLYGPSRLYLEQHQWPANSTDADGAAKFVTAGADGAAKFDDSSGLKFYVDHKSLGTYPLLAEDVVLVKQEWTAAYPYRLPPSLPPDTGQQVFKMAGVNVDIGAAKLDDSSGGKDWPVIGPDHNFFKDWPTIGPDKYLNENMAGAAAKTADFLKDWPTIGPDKYLNENMAGAAAKTAGFLKDWPTIGPDKYLNENMAGAAAKIAKILTDWPDIGPDRLSDKRLAGAAVKTPRILNDGPLSFEMAGADISGRVVEVEPGGRTAVT